MRQSDIEATFPRSIASETQPGFPLCGQVPAARNGSRIETEDALDRLGVITRIAASDGFAAFYCDSQAHCYWHDAQTGSGSWVVCEDDRKNEAGPRSPVLGPAEF